MKLRKIIEIYSYIENLNKKSELENELDRLGVNEEDFQACRKLLRIVVENIELLPKMTVSIIAL